MGPRSIKSALCGFIREVGRLIYGRVIREPRKVHTNHMECFALCALYFFRLAHIKQFASARLICGMWELYELVRGQTIKRDVFRN